MFTSIFLQIYISFLALGFSQGLFAFENKPFETVLKNKYNECEIKKENVFLKDADKKEIEKRLDFKISSLILRYSYPCSKSFIYVDSHLVRTLNETTLVEISKTDLKSIEIASFMEPTQYLPPKKWLDKLSLNEKIDGLTGATLSQNAILNVVKKYKVINQVLNDKNRK